MSVAISSAKSDPIESMRTAGVIPVFHHFDPRTLLPIINLVYRCGVRVFEFTHHRDNRNVRIFSTLIEAARDMPGMMLGIGTVPHSLAAKAYLKAGAHFIASPFLHSDTAKLCHQYGVSWIPGCSEEDDIEAARNLGAEVITVLPGAIPGPDFVRKARNRFPEMEMIPSTGMRAAENRLQGWFDAGAICIRLGESLFTKEAVATRDWLKIESSLFNMLQGVKQITTNKKNSVRTVL